VHEEGVSKRPLDAWQAAARGNVPALKKLREQGVDLSSADYDRRYARSPARWPDGDADDRAAERGSRSSPSV